MTELFQELRDSPLYQKPQSSPETFALNTELDFQLSEGTKWIFERARELIARNRIAIPAVSSSVALIAATRLNPFARDNYAQPFVRQFLVRYVGESAMENTFDAWLKWYDRAESAQSAPAAISGPLVVILLRALEIAQDTTGFPRIHARHFISALSTARDPEFGVVDLLASLQLNATTLARAMFNFLEQQAPRDTGTADDLDAWRRHLGLESDGCDLPRYETERAAGVDRLDIRRDVEAFATLIAAKSVEPPLSIGLFGDWGSGKSFFISKLQDKVKDLAGSKGTTFYKRIVQIDFNAWHYVQADLWASLVEHIFRNLRTTSEKPEDQLIEERRQWLIRELDTAMADRAQAEIEVERAQRERDRTAREIEEIKEKAEATAVSLEGLRAKDAWDLVQVSEDDRDKLKAALADLGGDRLVETVADVRDTVQQLRATGMRVRLLAQWAAQRPLALVVLAALILIAPIAAWKLLRGAPQLNAALTQFAALVVAFTSWIAGLIAAGKPLLDRLDAARRAIDTKVKDAEQKRQKMIRRQETALVETTEALKHAKSDLAAGDREIEMKRRELEDLTPSRRLARFIDDRAASDDYRKLLGVLAIVRGDFERLTHLLRNQKNEQQAKYGIDRIVLFIDDLDRCHPDRVVEVLQAVHLLLAYPLFVVVVGVDARWITESLRHKHRALWSDGKDSVAGYAAEPSDYLEKIFQIPFWLEPISAATTARFIRKLVAADVKADKPKIPVEPVALRPLDASSPEAAAISHETPSEERHVEQTDTEGVEPDGAPDPLSFQQKEVDAMASLAPVVDRSPRTVKRFVNTYRLLRAAIPARRREDFLEDTPTPDYRVVLFLLAGVVGAPTVALELFDTLQKALPDMKIDAFADKLRPPKADPKALAQHYALTNALIALGKEFTTMNVSHLVGHLRRVSRFSFNAPRAQMRPLPKKRSAKPPRSSPLSSDTTTPAS